MQSDKFDYVVIGSGVGGLFTAALLAHHGCRVCVLERHYVPGGYGHSFRLGGYTFCAQLHYLWNCGPHEPGGVVLRHLGLDRDITFSSLDPDGFDRLHFPSFRYNIVKGFDRNVEELTQRYPDHRQSIQDYFNIISRINGELLHFPIGFGPAAFLPNPLRFRHVLRYRNWTTDDLLQRLKLPLEVRSILAGQSGDLLLPPGKASLLSQACLVCGYDAGACVPTNSYEHLFQTLVDFIQQHDGCQVLLKHWVVSLDARRGRVISARTKKGRTIVADRFLFNGDPRLLSTLVDIPQAPWFQRRLKYEYSPSSFTIYCGVRGLDLTRFGFGNWNMWHYPHDDVNECYHRHLVEERMEDPTLFMSTPTLHQKFASIAPEGCDQLVICARCTYQHFWRFKQRGRTAYLQEKQRVANIILDQVERHYIPGLRDHLDLVVPGTPSTNERFVLAPEGNAYGANLTPRQLNVGKIDYRTPLANLWLVGATASVPSFAGGVYFAQALYEKLTGHRIPQESKACETSGTIRRRVTSSPAPWSDVKIGE